jgi:hypothetical protein
MNKLFIPLISALVFSQACKSKSKPLAKNYIPVLMLIKNQVAMVDTSLFTITRTVAIDSLKPDTSFIRREDFEATARDFLNIPDLGNPKIAAAYTEEEQYDSTFNRAIFTYTPVHIDLDPVKQQQVITDPDATDGKTVKNIYITRIINNRDSFVRQNLLWKMDQSFQVTTIKQLPGKPESVMNLRVSWNEN